MTKKIMAMVLCVVMVMSTFAVTAFAAKEETYTLKFDLVKKDKNISNEDEFKNEKHGPQDTITAGEPLLENPNTYTTFADWEANNTNIVSTNGTYYIGANERFTMTGNATLSARWAQVDITRTGKMNANKDTVTYTVKVTNTGDVMLNNVVITDDKLHLQNNSLNGTSDYRIRDGKIVLRETLKAGETFTYTYKVDASELGFEDEESIASTATVACTWGQKELTKTATQTFKDKLDLSVQLDETLTNVSELEDGDTMYYIATLTNPSGNKLNKINIDLPDGAKNIQVDGVAQSDTEFKINAGNVSKQDGKVIITFETIFKEKSITENGNIIVKVHADRKLWSESVTIKTSMTNGESSTDDEDEIQPQPATPSLLQMNVSAEDVTATFDGEAKSVAVSATNATNAIVTYSTTQAGTFTTEAPTFTEVGEYTVYYNVSGTGYASQSGSVTLTIEPRQVTATVDTVDAVYGTELPETFEIVFGGDAILEGDTLGVTATLTDILITGVDLYEGAIQVDYDGANANYEVTTTNGDLNITPATATILIGDAGKVVDGQDPDFSATVQGTIGNDLIGYTLEREAGEDVGTYAITATYEEHANYTITVEEGIFTITTAAPAPIADDQGEQEPQSVLPATAGDTVIPDQQVPAAGIGGNQNQTSSTIEEPEVPKSGIATSAEQPAPVQVGIDLTFLYIILGVVLLAGVGVVIAKKVADNK